MRPARPLQRVRDEIAPHASHEKWACPGSMNCRSAQCQDCDMPYHHHAGDGVTRCGPCIAYRAGDISADEWLSVHMGSAFLREEHGERWAEPVAEAGF